MIGLGMGAGMFFLILIFGGVILLALLVVKAIFPAGQQSSGSRPDRALTPMEILDRRYAHGEVTRDQYERMKLDLAD